jgi:translation initiation factor 1
MAAKKKRVDVSGERTPLTDSPFASLDNLKGGLPTQSVPQSAPKAEILEEVSVPYRVARTRKGGWPVSFEKRAAGKLVTVIGRVSGDGGALLKALRKLCATGGVLKEDVIELQGDHRARVEDYLSKHLT